MTTALFYVAWLATVIFLSIVVHRVATRIQEDRVSRFYDEKDEHIDVPPPEIEFDRGKWYYDKPEERLIIPDDADIPMNRDLIIPGNEPVTIQW